MKKLLRQWRLFKMFKERLGDSCDMPVEWTPEDADQMKAWAASYTGQKVMSLIRWGETVNYKEACLNRDGGEFQRGHAAGYGRCVAFVEMLSVGSEPQSGQIGKDGHGAAVDPATRYAP